MLLPKFTIRWILGAMFCVALLFVVARQAIGGEPWAISIVAVVGLTTLIFFLYGLSFLGSYAMLRVLRRYFPPVENQNPFAVEGQFPPQQVPKNSVQSEG